MRCYLKDFEFWIWSDSTPIPKDLSMNCSPGLAAAGPIVRWFEQMNSAGSNTMRIDFRSFLAWPDSATLRVHFTLSSVLGIRIDSKYWCHSMWGSLRGLMSAEIVNHCTFCWYFHFLHFCTVTGRLRPKSIRIALESKIWSFPL